MRLKSSRVRGSSALAVVGGCLGVYVVLATGFHWLVEPTLGKNQGVTAYEPSPARIVPDARQTVAAPVRSEPASRLASKPSTTDGDRALRVAVARRIRTAGLRHNRGGGVHGARPCRGEENPHQAQDRSPRAALARDLEPDELLCLGFC